MPVFDVRVLRVFFSTCLLHPWKLCNSSYTYEIFVQSDQLCCEHPEFFFWRYAYHHLDHLSKLKKKKTYRILTAMGFHHWPLFRQKMRKRLLCVHFALYTRNIRTNGFHRLKAVCLSFPTPYRRPFKSIPTIWKLNSSLATICQHMCQQKQA